MCGDIAEAREGCSDLARQLADLTYTEPTWSVVHEQHSSSEVPHSPPEPAAGDSCADSQSSWEHQEASAFAAGAAAKLRLSGRRAQPISLARPSLQPRYYIVLRNKFGEKNPSGAWVVKTWAECRELVVILRSAAKDPSGLHIL